MRTGRGIQSLLESLERRCDVYYRQPRVGRMSGKVSVSKSYAQHHADCPPSDRHGRYLWAIKLPGRSHRWLIGCLVRWEPWRWCGHLSSAFTNVSPSFPTCRCRILIHKNRDAPQRFRTRLEAHDRPGPWVSGLTTRLSSKIGRWW